MMITASAPLDGSVKSFIEIAFGCPMIEAYGLSESSGAICATSQEDKLSWWSIQML
jgi:long-subunit acyl-CoA synthetase (AMP-forming)